jgi:hypothetical protein
MDDLRTAFDKIGRVVESSDALHTITGKSRYGLQSIKLRVAVISHPEGSIVEIQAFGDDIWGGCARKGADKLLRALDELASSP